MMNRFSLMEQELQQALKNDEFELYYQPKVGAASGRVTGVEALLRWHHPRLGLLSGGQFMQAAVETGQAVSIGEWVIGTACMQARSWQCSSKAFPNLSVAINITPPQLYADLPDVIHRALRRSDIPPSSLQLEISESLLTGDVDNVSPVLSEISDSGITIAIDEFGTGYSSLSVLKSLPIDILKIDHSFVRDLGKDSGDHAIVSAIVMMARTMALRVIAVGVETQEQLDLLRELDCDEHQGNFYSKPLAAAALAEKFLNISN